MHRWFCVQKIPVSPGRVWWPATRNFSHIGSFTSGSLPVQSFFFFFLPFKLPFKAEIQLTFNFCVCELTTHQFLKKMSFEINRICFLCLRNTELGIASRLVRTYTASDQCKYVFYKSPAGFPTVLCCTRGVVGNWQVLLHSMMLHCPSKCSTENSLPTGNREFESTESVGASEGSSIQTVHTTVFWCWWMPKLNGVKCEGKLQGRLQKRNRIFLFEERKERAHVQLRRCKRQDRGTTFHCEMKNMTDSKKLEKN